MTDDPRLLDLVQADLDGRLDGAEKAELARRLLADPAARRLHDELRRTHTLLHDLPQVEPPDGLRSAIQGALGLSDHDRGGRRVVDGGVGFRLAAAVVAGLVVVGLGYGLLNERSDTTGLQGSIAAGTAPVATLRAGGGQVVARLEHVGEDRIRLVLEPSGTTAGELAVIPGAQGASCRSEGASPTLSTSPAGESILALSGGAARVVLDCAGEGQVRLETRTDGTVQDTATVAIGR